MPKRIISPRSANALDMVIGAQLRKRREERSLSQKVLAEMVGITFQQIQKYEKAANRVSASRLYVIAEVLDVPLTYFFEPAAKERSRGKAKAKKRA